MIGLPVRQKILVEIHTSEFAEKIGKDEITSAENHSLIDQRDHIVARIAQRCTQTHQRMADNLDSILPRDLEALLQQIERCGKCRECFENCPLCDSDYPARDEVGLYAREEVKQWMISCAGCGMCEQACPNHLPLVIIFSQIRGQLMDSVEGTAQIP